MFELYSYTEEERAAFAYIDRYMNSIERLSPATEFPALQFALAGLFLTYRASNHSGVRMTTHVRDIDFRSDSIHYRRLAEFEPLTGQSFESMHEYFRLSRINIFGSSQSVVAGSKSERGGMVGNS
jgi:hypothetical protein